jgi:CDGSH-type Zn-finger protein
MFPFRTILRRIVINISSLDIVLMKFYGGTSTMVSKKNKSQPDKYSVKICKNGPYLISGGVPLLEKKIKYDVKWDSCEWEDGKTFPRQDSYALCRCGQSHTKPFCDGTHEAVKFDGTETAHRDPYLKNAIEIIGPDLKLTDVKDLCASARFCHRAGGI